MKRRCYLSFDMPNSGLPATSNWLGSGMVCVFRMEAALRTFEVSIEREWLLSK